MTGSVGQSSHRFREKQTKASLKGIFSNHQWALHCLLLRDCCSQAPPGATRQPNDSISVEQTEKISWKQRRWLAYCWTFLVPFGSSWRIGALVGCHGLQASRPRAELLWHWAWPRESPRLTARLRVYHLLLVRSLVIWSLAWGPQSSATAL